MMKLISLLLLFSLSASAGFPPTTSKLSSDSTDAVTFKYRFPYFAGTHSGTVVSLGTLGVLGGGTGTGTQFTSGSVVFADGSGVYSQDNANLFYDSTNKYLGIGTSSPDARLKSYGASTDPSSSIQNGYFFNNPTFTVDNSQGVTTLRSTLRMNPAVGATASGQGNALLSEALVISGQGGGTVSALNGNRINYGIQTGGTGTVTNAYGIRISPYHQAGTIGTSYGLRIDAPATGGTVGSEYGIYQASTTASNYFAGFVGIGASSPSAVLHIAGSKTGTPGANGSQLLGAAATFTDNNTAASGTAAAYVAYSLSAPTIAASNTGVTTTSAQNLRVNGPVNAGTNETITNDYGIFLATNNVASAGGTVTNATGLAVAAPTGATNNYTAVFTGGNVGIGSTSPGSTLHVAGSYQGIVTTVSVDLSLTSSHQVLAVNANAAARTLTLPAASSSIIGRVYRIKKTDSSANTVTIAVTGSDTIDGASSYVLSSQYQSVDVICTSSSAWSLF